MDTITSAIKQMSQAIEILRDDLGTIRAGRSNSQFIEGLKIRAYEGTAELTLTELATITASDSKTLIVTPYDSTVIKDIENGINQANLGVSVTQDGRIIRVIAPPMTEERRQEFIKLSKTKTEGVHVMIRQARQEAMNSIRKEQQLGELSEDEKSRFEKEVQKATDDKTKEANILLENKIKELESI